MGRRDLIVREDDDGTCSTAQFRSRNSLCHITFQERHKNKLSSKCIYYTRFSPSHAEHGRPRLYQI